MRTLKSLVLTAMVAMVGLATVAAKPAPVVSKPFKGVKANTGTVSADKVNGRIVLTLSADFQAPDAPDPHWQVVDARGNVYLLNKLSIKDGKMNRSVTLPVYIKDVTKVQMWCAFVEVLLGEAEFETVVK
jgi:hypothetical protein